MLLKFCLKLILRFVSWHQTEICLLTSNWQSWRHVNIHPTRCSHVNNNDVKDQYLTIWLQQSNLQGPALISCNSEIYKGGKIIASWLFILLSKTTQGIPTFILHSCTCAISLWFCSDCAMVSMGGVNHQNKQTTNFSRVLSTRQSN